MVRTPKEYVAADGTVTWRVRFRNGIGRAAPSTSETFDDLKSAQTFARELDLLGPAVALKRLHEKEGRSDVPTLDEVAHDYIDLRTGVQDGTREEYVRLWDRTWGALIGELPADSVTHDDIAKAVNVLTRTYSVKSVHNQRGLLAGVCKRAMKLGYLADNPVDGIRITALEHEDNEMVFLTPDEFDILYRHVPEQWQPLVRFFAGTGARWGEVAALTVADFKDGRIRINKAVKRRQGGWYVGPPKTKRSRRTVDLPREVVEDLTEIVKGRPASALLFTGPKGGRMKHNDFWAYVWRPSIWRAQHCAEHTEDGCKCGTGRPKRCPLHKGAPPGPCGCAGTLTKTPRIHDLRHTHASWLIDANVPGGLATVRDRLGHESITTTVDRYGHLLPDTQKAAAAAADAVFAARRPELGS